MFRISTAQQLQNALEKSLLPSRFHEYLAAEYEGLRQALHHEETLDFSLEDHGYNMIVLVPGDGCSSSLGVFNMKALMDSHPEYVEIIPLSEKVFVFRACFLLDNECLIMMYAVKGTLEPQLEQRLNDFSEEAVQ